MDRFILTVLSIGSFVAAPAAAQQSRATTAPAPPAITSQQPATAQTPQPAPPPPAVPARQSGVASTTTPAQGQQGQRGQVPQAQPLAPGQMAPRRLPTQNVRVDITITDAMGTGTAKKTVTMLVADGRSGQVRSTMQIPQTLTTGPVGSPASYSYANITLNVDASPEVLPDGRIYITMNVQYTPDTAQEPGGSRKPGALNEALAVVLGDGKQTLISQSADPQGDRKVTLELTATIVK